MTKPPIERWFNHISINHSSGCWEWSGYVNPRGYGRMGGVGRRTVLAHRLAYEHFIGPAGDLFVLHHCDNPKCSNPDHLFIGTNADNCADMVAKGRSNRGAKMWNAKLTYDAVIAIRRRLSSGERSYLLATEYGVSRQTISLISSRVRWAWA